MNVNSWTSPTSSPRKDRSKKQRHISVNDILKAAYQRYERGRETAKAVKHCLG